MTSLGQRKIARYGYRRDDHDPRDHRLTLDADAPLPSLVDLRSLLPACWNQGQLGSCTSFGVAAGVAAARAKQGEAYFEPSHLFIYWNERAVEGTVQSDAGAQVRDGIKVAAKLGVPPESAWRYSDTGTKWRRRPPKRAFAEAVQHEALAYRRVDNSGVRQALAQTGLPVVFGFTVFQDFESQRVADTGEVPMPDLSTQPVGGHCVAAVGYDDAREAICIRNSWGEWGDGGHAWLPYAYVANPSLASDFWSISLES